MSPPKTTAGNHRNRCLIAEDSFSVPIQHGKRRPARIIGTGRSGQNNQIIVLKALRGQGLNRQSLAEQGHNHLFHGLGNSTDGKMLFLNRNKAFSEQRKRIFLQALNYCADKFSCLRAQGILENKDTLGRCRRAGHGILLRVKDNRDNRDKSIPSFFLISKNKGDTLPYNAK